MLIEKRDSANNDPPAINIKANNFVFIMPITSLPPILQRRCQSVPRKKPMTCCDSAVDRVASKHRSGAFEPLQPRAEGRSQYAARLNVGKCKGFSSRKRSLSRSRLF